MSQPWFRVDVEVVDHPKVHHLEAILGPNAGWYLIRLWTWTARYASRGRLATVARASLERSCGWTGKPGELVAAFIATGLIDETTTDELEVHDWWEKQGATVQKAENDRERLKASRAARGIVARQSSDAREVVAGDVTLRNVTVRNREEEKPSSPTIPPVAAFEIVPPNIETIDSWTKEDFWKAAEITRRTAGFPPQKWPSPVALSRWWAEARQVADTRELADAFVKFTEAKHWREKATPPCPWNSFASQYLDFLPSKGAA